MSNNRTEGGHVIGRMTRSGFKAKAMIWLWLIPYLVVGVVLSRAMGSRADISKKVDAFAIIVVWPLFLVALVIRWVVNIVGALGGGKR